MKPKDQTIADPLIFFSQVRSWRMARFIFGSGDGNLYALDSATGDLRWNSKPAMLCTPRPPRRRRFVFGSWTVILRCGRCDRKREMAFHEAKTR